MEEREPEQINETDDEVEVTIREFTPSDFNYVVKTWLNSYKYSPWAGVIPNNVYTKVYGETLRQLFARGLQVRCLVPTEVPEIILGWVAYEQKDTEIVVHYLYTQNKFRERGYANHLLTDIGVESGAEFVYTFKTSYAKYFKNAKHLPAIGRRQTL